MSALLLRTRQILPVLLALVPLLLITFPNITYVQVFESGSAAKIVTRTAYFLFLFLIPLGFFGKRIRWYFYLLFPLLPLALATNYLYKFLQMRSDTDSVMLVADSNVFESSEFLSLVPFSYLLLSGLLMALYLFCVHRLPRSISFRKAASITVASSFLFLAVPLVRYGTGNFGENLRASVMYFFPFNLIQPVKQSLEMKLEMYSHASRTKNFRFGASKKSVQGKEIHALVIGETSRRSNWSLYGYGRKTSPLLEKRKLFVFTDAISSGYITNRSVPILLTRATPADFGLHLREKSLISAFQEAGFKTYWVNSNGQATGIYIHSRNSDHYLQPTIAQEEELAGVLRKILAEEASDQVLLIFHTGGSHWRYDARYPDAFDRFKPSLKQGFGSPSEPANREAIVNSYDNSILYTDFVLDRLIQALEATKHPATLTYISDHGENLLDDSRNFFLHNQATKNVAEVPLFVWASEKYKGLHPGIVRALERNRAKKISSENLFSSLLDLAGIEIHEATPQKSFANVLFQERERSVIRENGEVVRYSELE